MNELVLFNGQILPDDPEELRNKRARANIHKDNPCGLSDIRVRVVDSEDPRILYGHGTSDDTGFVKVTIPEQHGYFKRFKSKCSHQMPASVDIQFADIHGHAKRRFLIATGRDPNAYSGSNRNHLEKIFIGRSFTVADAIYQESLAKKVIQEVENAKSVVLKGDPGSGKSTALSKASELYLARKNSGLCFCYSFESNPNPRHFFSALDVYLETHSRCSRDPGRLFGEDLGAMLKECLPITFFIDGFDDLSDNGRDRGYPIRILDGLNRMLSGNLVSCKHRIVVTCRNLPKELTSSRSKLTVLRPTLD